MNISRTINRSTAGTSLHDFAYSQRSALLSEKNRKIADSLPHAVRNYLDGHDADFAAVKWAFDENEVTLFRQLFSEGFSQSLAEHDTYGQKMAEMYPGNPAPAPLGPAIELSPDEQINSKNVHLLTLLLQMPGANFTKLQLDLSSDIEIARFEKLLEAIDALPHLPALEIKVNGQSGGPIVCRISLALAGSKAGLSTTTTRSLIGGIDNPDNLAAAWQAEAQRKLAGAEDPRTEYDDLVTAETLRGRAAAMRIQAAALQAAPRALQAFLSMEICPDTGKPIKDEYVDALARIALVYGNHGLLRAVCMLAPHYKMQFLELPDARSMEQLVRCGTACIFQLDARPDVVIDLSVWLRHYGALFVDIRLTVTQDLSRSELKELLETINTLPAMEHFSFTINPGICLEIDGLSVDGYFKKKLSSLILNGGEFAGSNDTVLLSLVHEIFEPFSLSLQVGTPGAAACILALTAKQAKHERPVLEELNISCAMSADPQEPSLLEVIQGLLLNPHHLVNVQVQSQESLVADEDEKARLIRLTHSNPPEGDIRLEHFSSSSGGWQTSLRINSRLRELAATFFPLHRKPSGDPGELFRDLPSDIGRHAVNIGAMSMDDVRALVCVSQDMNATWSRVSRTHNARVIAFELSHNMLNDQSLLTFLSLRTGPLDQGTGPLDQDLASEVRAILNEQKPKNEIAIATLDRVAPVMGS
ncbi:hypothetical protein [Variovorax guangxiensis]|uniref:hypothetical protein n=1 Tax=Variovorax guangxiensis TaxID=1775474 RepID=UPI00285D5D37|nr:hypothetical protein [Variovorax guangxiensis]MDR6857289.1 hypothetical protein [Variovorax guangxiensis]